MKLIVEEDKIKFQVKKKEIDEFNDLLMDTIRGQDILTSLENIALESKDYPYINLPKEKIREIIIKDKKDNFKDLFSFLIKPETFINIRFYEREISGCTLDHQGYLILFLS
ncbi:MAG: hypothetical protein ACFFCS_22575 [Candidatus Hodarchaeota archaeon]